MISRFSTFLAELFEKPWQHIDTTEVRLGGLWLVSYIYADPNYTKDDTPCPCGSGKKFKQCCAPTNWRKGNLAVVFQQQNRNSWALIFNRGGSFTAKGQGDASGVFASVLDATKKFLKKYNPEFIEFTADKDKGNSRERAYAALVKRFVSQYGYTVDYSASNEVDAMWKLKRVKEDFQP